MSIFDGSDYIAWRKQRLDALEKHLGLDWLSGLTVLELGAGCADMSGMLLSIGASSVLAVDGRQDYVDAARSRGIDSVCLDLDVDEPPVGPFDVVFNVGLMYHLADPLRSIRVSIARARKFVVLETEVVDSFDNFVKLLDEHGRPDDGVGQKGGRPSPSAVESCVTELGWSHELVDVPDSPSGHRYRWELSGSGAAGSQLYRRMWVCRPGRSTD